MKVIINKKMDTIPTNNNYYNVMAGIIRKRLEKKSTIIKKHKGKVQK